LVMVAGEPTTLFATGELIAFTARHSTASLSK